MVCNTIKWKKKNHIEIPRITITIRCLLFPRGYFACFVCSGVSHFLFSLLSKLHINGIRQHLIWTFNVCILYYRRQNEFVKLFQRIFKKYILPDFQPTSVKKFVMSIQVSKLTQKCKAILNLIHKYYTIMFDPFKQLRIENVLI